jgi:hypothetical protein
MKGNVAMIGKFIFQYKFLPAHRTTSVNDKEGFIHKTKTMKRFYKEIQNQ